MDEGSKKGQIMNAQQPKDYPMRHDFEIRDYGKTVILYKKLPGHKPQIITLDRRELAQVVRFGRGLNEC